MKRGEKNRESAALRFLYGTALGRVLLRPLCSRWFSKLAGALLDRPASRLLIRSFVRRQGIDLGDYVPARYASFNDFFCRRIRSELRPVDQNPAALIAPCDGLLSAYPVEQGTVIPAKQSRYTLAQLLGSQALAAPFSGGWCLVFRLAVRHYHRYCFPDNGVIADYGFLPGVLHTVRPVALARGPVFCQNCRAYTVLEAAHLGHAVQLEVGAMLVGRIVNRKQTGAFARGEEKGLFQYGGSTVILLLEPGRITLDEALLRASRQGRETPVHLGQRIGTVKLEKT